MSACATEFIFERRLKSHDIVLQVSQWDLVVSGINRGDNLGLHVIYSGTVGAAREAACKAKLPTWRFFLHVNDTPAGCKQLFCGGGIIQHHAVFKTPSQPRLVCCRI